MAEATRYGPSQNKRSGTLSWSPTWVAELKDVGLLLLLSQVFCDLNQHYSMRYQWHKCGLTHCFSIPASRFIISKNTLSQILPLKPCFWFLIYLLHVSFTIGTYQTQCYVGALIFIRLIIAVVNNLPRKCFLWSLKN